MSRLATPAPAKGDALRHALVGAVLVGATILIGSVCFFASLAQARTGARRRGSSRCWSSAWPMATIHLLLPPGTAGRRCRSARRRCQRPCSVPAQFAAILLVVATTLAQSTVRTRLASRPHRTPFNSGSPAITVTLAGITHTSGRVS